MENQNTIQEFTSIFGNVRSVIRKDEPWFVASDVLKILNIAQSGHALDRLEDDEKGWCPVPTLGGTQSLSVISESGLYHLIFSCMPRQARGISKVDIEERIQKISQFRKWVTNDVLPTLRKTGAYIDPSVITVTPEDDFVNVVASAAENGINAAVARAVQSELLSDPISPAPSSEDVTVNVGVTKDEFVQFAMHVKNPKAFFRTFMLFLDGRPVYYKRFSSKSYAKLLGKFYYLMFKRHGMALITRQSQSQGASKMDCIHSDEWSLVFPDLYDYGVSHGADFTEFFKQLRQYYLFLEVRGVVTLK